MSEVNASKFMGNIDVIYIVDKTSTQKGYCYTVEMYSG